MLLLLLLLFIFRHKYSRDEWRVQNVTVRIVEKSEMCMNTTQIIHSYFLSKLLFHISHIETTHRQTKHYHTMKGYRDKQKTQMFKMHELNYLVHVTIYKQLFIAVDRQDDCDNDSAIVD